MMLVHTVSRSCSNTQHPTPNTQHQYPTIETGVILDAALAASGKLVDLLI